MSITSDRAELATALATVKSVQGNELTVLAAPGRTAQPYTVFIDLAAVEPGLAFGSLGLTWEVTGTTSARLDPAHAAGILDELTDGIIRAVHGAKAADLQSIEPYFVLTDNSSGGAIPATRLTFTSQTPIN